MARILYVEDDAGSRLLVRKLLEAAGHEVLLATTGLEGLRVASEQQVDLVLVDIDVPDLDGYEITLRLRGMPRLSRVPIVAVTAAGDRQTSLAVGCDGFLEKPLDAKRFPRQIERFLGGHRERADESGEIRLRDVSQRIVEHLEKKVVELSEANARLEELARLRREFLQNLSHELATPLTPVVGYLKLLGNGELGPVTPTQKKALLAIEQGTVRLRALVDTLLDVSSLETGRMHFFRREYDFGQIAHKALEEARPRFQERRLRIAALVPPRPMPGLGDADKLRRAMAHLLDNAVKFTPAGGELAIEAVAVAPDPRAPDRVRYELRVADSGPGIAQHQIEKVLDAFYQADGSATRAHGGVGLGLAFARRVAEAHGGAVQISSPPRDEVARTRLGGAEVRLVVLARPADSPLPPRP